MTISIKRSVRTASIASMAALACGISATVSAQETCVDLSTFQEGQSLEGDGTVEMGLEIKNLSPGEIVKIVEDGSQTYAAYGAGADSTLRNGGLASDGGFANVTQAKANEVHEYAFLFADGVSSFTLMMRDFGDFNPLGSRTHLAVMKAYDADDAFVEEKKLEYTSDGRTNPLSSDPYGQLFSNSFAAAGDALGGKPPGVWEWEVQSISAGIEKIELKFPVGMDPKIGFDSLCYEPHLIDVNINVHPNSDPNPLNLLSGGSTPVAILGSATFDVSQIDISTLGLGSAGVKIVGRSERSLCSVADVGSYDEAEFDHLGAPDGTDDLVCHFVTSEIVPSEDGEAVTVTVTGKLLPEFGETQFEGSDIVKIVKE